MSRYWFRPKTYGYGATPTTWQGWVAMVAYVAIVSALTVPLFFWPQDMPSSPKFWQVATWGLMVALLTFGFVRLSRTKTDGQWSWRWGK